MLTKIINFMEIGLFDFWLIVIAMIIIRFGMKMVVDEEYNKISTRIFGLFLIVITIILTRALFANPLTTVP